MAVNIIILCIVNTILVLTLATVSVSSETTDQVLGVPCIRGSDCKADSSYCISGKCECDSGFVPDEDNKRCLTTLLGDACAVDSDCRMTPVASNCRDQQCLACNESTADGYSHCPDLWGCAYHEYNNKCWKYREIGESCRHNEECWIYPNSATTRVCSKICVCAKDYVYISTSVYGVDTCMLEAEYDSRNTGFVHAASGWLTILLASSISRLLS